MTNWVMEIADLHEQLQELQKRLNECARLGRQALLERNAAFEARDKAGDELAIMKKRFEFMANLFDEQRARRIAKLLKRYGANSSPMALPLDFLTDRERYIFEARRHVPKPVTLRDLADEFGVTPTRVRQIEIKALRKVTRRQQHDLGIN